MTICPICEEPVLMHPLSPREWEIARLCAAGYTYIEIADRLVLDPDTVRTHRRHIWQKQHLHSKRDFVWFAVQNGLMPTEKDE